MKPFFLFLFLMTYLNCFGQDRGMFNQVILSYSKGSSWTGRGVFNTNEIIEISRLTSESYKITKYIVVKSGNYLSDGKHIFRKDTLNRKIKPDKRILQVQIDSLLEQLNTTKDNFTLAFIKPLLKKPSKRKILAVSKKIDEHYKFEDYKPSDLMARINLIKHFDKIDSFIKINQPDPELFHATVDAWNDLKISFIKNNDTTIFTMDFLQPLGQPVLKLRADTEFITKQFVNLEVNTLITEMVPETSALKKQIEVNSLTDDYIKWYIDKVL